MGTVEPMSKAGVALDLILKTLIASQDFNDIQNKNWEAISRLIPGTSSGMVARRYEELLYSGDLLPFDQFEKNMSGPGSRIPSSMSDSDPAKNSRPSSAMKPKGGKDEKDQGGKENVMDRHSLDKGPMMVIHVCDEAKNLKQDFQCPRDLLVQEMKYFAEYLSTDAQRWEEVDISVHCDVQIFEWLMKYVKRNDSDKPKLEPNNVISILISSDFLKMDSLVQECIEYCHGNMSAIVSTPCNMNCINDKLVGRIADLFTLSEADDIKDRKDKFKSKLFSKKLEKLFETNSNNDCIENASTLFRCSICKKMLTKNLERKVKCMPSRMTVDKRGQLTFCHIRDPNFEVNQYLIDLKAQLKNWRDVYWRVWGTIHYQYCSRCFEMFSLTDYGHCKYHPEVPRYDNDTSDTSYIGTYPCCHQKCLRFDPTGQNKGCRVRDHVINLPQVNPGSEVDLQKQQNKVYDDLLAHRDVICVPYQRLSDARFVFEMILMSSPNIGLGGEYTRFQTELQRSEMDLNVFGNEEFASNVRSEGIAISSIISGIEDDASVKSDSARPVPRLQALTVDREVSFEYDDTGMGESDDEVGDDEQPKNSTRRGRGLKKSRVTIDPQAILMDAPGFEQTKKSTWDTGRSMRYNQDAQRSEDLRRMKEIQVYLTKLRLNPEKIEKPKKEYAGGIFCRLESQWKAAYMQQLAKQQEQNKLRNRSRFTQLRSSLT